MTVSEARAALADVLERVAAGEEVTLTRHGEPVAVVVRPDRLRSRRADEAYAQAERVRRLMEESRTRPLESEPGLTGEQADALIAEVRRSRDAR